MSKFKVAIPARSELVWPGLGHWNLYFMLKFALHWSGYLNVQALPNLVFVSFLLMPLSNRFSTSVRRLIALPVAVVLFYRDTWLPPLSEWMDWPSMVDFSFSHLLAVVEQLVDWNLCGWLLVLLVVYLFVQPWLRMTTLSLAGLVSLSTVNLLALTPGDESSFARIAAGDTVVGANAAIDTYLQKFYSAEAERQVVFHPLSSAAQHFDLLLINIDSMAWDDLYAIGLSDHPLLRKMDLLFDRFNSATSERIPATLRLLRAGCGQAPRSQFYALAAESCLLFDQLGKQGFVRETLLNHTGQLAGFLNAIQTLGSLPRPEIDISHFRPMLLGPDGSPVLRDLEVLDAWWKHRQEQLEPRVALFYNTLTLHEDNHVVTAEGGNRRTDYKSRAQVLLDDLNSFIEQLELSGRPVVVIIVPDHGAALRGDRMQFPGMRQIPSPLITQVPVGIKVVGMGRNPRSTPLHVSESSSYLALAQIINRLYATPLGPEGQQPDWRSLLAGLAKTSLVSESESGVVLDYAAKPYVRIKEKDAWLPYRSIPK